MIVYRGIIDHDGHARVYKDGFGDTGGTAREITPYTAWSHLRQSPNALKPSCTGFEWGYHGAGPHCLALALLLDVLGASRWAIAFHERFAQHFCFNWPAGKSWAISHQEIYDWVLRQPDYVITIQEAMSNPSAFVKGMMKKVTL